jgi:hypothetical protein
VETSSADIEFTYTPRTLLDRYHDGIVAGTSQLLRRTVGAVIRLSLVLCAAIVVVLSALGADDTLTFAAFFVLCAAFGRSVGLWFNGFRYWRRARALFASEQSWKGQRTWHIDDAGIVINSPSLNSNIPWSIVTAVTEYDRGYNVAFIEPSLQVSGSRYLPKSVISPNDRTALLRAISSNDVNLVIHKRPRIYRIMALPEIATFPTAYGKSVLAMFSIVTLVPGLMYLADSSLFDAPQDRIQWYQAASITEDPGGCDLEKPVPPNTPNSSGLCVRIYIESESGTGSVREVLTDGTKTLVDRTVYLQDGWWTFPFREAKAPGTYSLVIYVDGLVSRTGVVVVGQKE